MPIKRLGSGSGGGGPVSGDVFGPAFSTDRALVRFDGITGKLVQNSRATLSDQSELNLRATAGFVPSFALELLGFTHTLPAFLGDNTSVQYRTDSTFGGAFVKSISTGDVNPYFHQVAFSNPTPLSTVAAIQYDVFKDDGLGAFDFLDNGDLAFAISNFSGGAGPQLVELRGNGDLNVLGGLECGGRFKTSTASTTASANDLILPTDGAFFPISGATQINRIASLNWTDGSSFICRFLSAGCVVKHGQASGGGFVKINNTASVDYTSTVGSHLHFVFYGGEFYTTPMYYA